MSDESFLERWARRKREAAKSVTADAKGTSGVADGEATPGQPVAAPADRTGESPEATPAVGRASTTQDVDLAALPSIDSITAETDIRGFLSPGVPAQLSRAALRRAWSADPAIRDFVGLADYDWDFNTEGAIAGFGRLEMTDELRRRVSDMVGRGLAPEPTERRSAPLPEPAADAREIAHDPGHPVGRDAGPDEPGARASNAESEIDQSSSRICERPKSIHAADAASQQALASSAKEREVVPRRHGGALPT